MFSITRLVIALLLASAVSGCGDPERLVKALTIRSASMAASGAQFQGNISVGEVTGFTKPLLIPYDVTPAQFRSALERSLIDAGLGTASPTGRFLLTVNLEPTDFPGMFIPNPTTLRAVVKYKLVEVSTGREVLSASFEEVGVGSYPPYFKGDERAGASILAALRQSISHIIQDLRGAAGARS